MLSEDKEVVFVPTYRRCAAGCRRFFISDRSVDSPDRSRLNSSPLRLGAKLKKSERCPYCKTEMSPDKKGSKGEKSVRNESPYLTESPSKKGLTWNSRKKDAGAESKITLKGDDYSRTNKGYQRADNGAEVPAYESPEYYKAGLKPSASYDPKSQKDQGDTTAYESSPEYYRSSIKGKGSPSFADNEFRGNSGDLLGLKQKHTVQFENSPSLNPLMSSGPVSAYRSPEYANTPEKSKLLGSQSSYASTGLKSSELRTVSATSNGSRYMSSSRPSTISDYPSPLAAAKTQQTDTQSQRLRSCAGQGVGGIEEYMRPVWSTLRVA
eukprot:CAMPEP_0204905536 /NCGR_PEP_ID=MMETSP1397-20131031/5472_1 /ASSEMBLY_ACC=CAM_ASM_000891 /TAXON_ID=49980 /ORGANISM="Climacostomum Climacostomum virens, Strain Stock W-24" /LENGTH=322 /DNA_ID=CAMNT_0052074421 /DNA_START=12 /DNA_END=981 /DNA_ORIENTATION=-